MKKKKIIVKIILLLVLVNNLSNINFENIVVLADNKNYSEEIKEADEENEKVVEADEDNEKENDEGKNNKEESEEKEKVIGWVKENGQWYYYDENYEMVKGWVNDHGSWYYLNDEGKMETGWLFYKGDKYYLKDSGAMAIGWIKVNDKWYYAKENGPIKMGWLKEQHKWYFLNEEGEMLKDWRFIEGKWYYLEANGEMAIGWKFIDGRWYYLESNGEMAIGWRKLNGQWYYLKNSGAMASNEVIDQWFLDKDGKGSQVITTGSYGVSGKKRNLEYYRIGNGKKVLIAVFGVHGFEDAWKNDGEELKIIAEDSITRLKNMYNRNENLDKLSEWSVYIIPSANPDGLLEGWTNYGPGRTTITTKIDINRSFPIGFRPIFNDNRNYTGSTPLIAPEAEALYDFINEKMEGATEKILLDVHGWENKTIGNREIGKFFGDQFKFPNVESYPGGFIISYGNSIGAKSSLVEFPVPKSKKDIRDRNFSGKFSNGLINILMSK